MGFSSYLRNRVLDQLFNGAEYRLPNVWVSLHGTEPGDTGAGEFSGGEYRRQPISFRPASAGTATNQGVVDFVDMPAGDVVGFGLWDAAQRGNFLGGGAFLDVRSVRPGDTYRILTGNISVALD